MIFLCGLFFPIASIPAFIRPLSYLFPLTYGVDILHGAIQGKNTIPLSLNFAVMAGQRWVGAFSGFGGILLSSIISSHPNQLTQTVWQFAIDENRMTEYPRMNKYKQNFLPVLISVLLTLLGTIAVLYLAGWLSPPQANRQETVHDMGSNVLPFDLSQTTHIFEMTEHGGVQQVIAKDPNDSEQIALIMANIG
jgi:hypothetical protein